MLSILQRFSGPDGRTHLVEALEIQPIAGEDAAIAKAISGCVEVAQLQPGTSIICHARRPAGRSPA